MDSKQRHRRSDVGLLRAYIREALRQGPSGPGVTSDPSEKGGGARDYELQRGVDIHGYWYRSPGDKGSGNPGRPDDAGGYIGMTAPEGGAAPAEEAGEEL